LQAEKKPILNESAFSGQSVLDPGAANDYQEDKQYENNSRRCAQTTASSSERHVRQPPPYHDEILYCRYSLLAWIEAYFADKSYIFIGPAYPEVPNWKPL